ncbi:Coiled-coil domain-containing protein 7 [Varanus komodoensis]|nr:Coiled-coil domain-containing protein 7 [Varanus komodoensis]
MKITEQAGSLQHARSGRVGEDEAPGYLNIFLKAPTGERKGQLGFRLENASATMRATRLKMVSLSPPGSKKRGKLKNSEYDEPMVLIPAVPAESVAQYCIALPSTTKDKVLDEMDMLKNITEHLNEIVYTMEQVYTKTDVIKEEEEEEEEEPTTSKEDQDMTSFLICCSQLSTQLENALREEKQILESLLKWFEKEVHEMEEIMTYKALNGLGPGYLNERLRPYMPDRPLRSAGESLLREPSMKETRRVSTWRRAFSVVAPNLWNSLPKEVRLAPSLRVFRRQVKTFLFKHHFNC